MPQFLSDITAPESIKIRPDSETTLIVTFIPKAGTTPTYFNSYIKGSSPLKICQVNGDVRPTECKLTGLRPATEYTIEAQACKEPTNGGGADACSQVKDAKGMTLPSCEWVFYKRVKMRLI